jgi:CheY-like chemotaxis protein
VSAPLAATEPEPSQRSDATVLLIDDQEEVLEVALEFLERAGFKVRSASSGKAGVELLQKHLDTIDLVVLDLVMPEMSGEQTFDRLRSLRADIPILLVSGYDREGVAERFVGRGIAGFLSKPYEAEGLIESVRSALEG